MGKIKGNASKFEIIEQIGVIGTAGDWTKEVNLVSWHGKPAKIDIRDWDEDHIRMSKGIALRIDHARELYKALGDYFNRDENRSDSRDEVR